MSKVVYKVTSEQPCQINVLGEFAAGETKTITDPTVLDRFERIHRHTLGASRFPDWITVEVITEGEPVKDQGEPEEDEDSAEAEEDTEETEEA